MKWNFKKSVKLGFIRINISNSGVGGSVGIKGLRKGIDAKGRSYTHASIPGTGIYSRTYDSKNGADRDYDSRPSDPTENLQSASRFSGQEIGVIVFSLVLFGVVWGLGESFWFALFLSGPAFTVGWFSCEKGPEKMLPDFDVEAEFAEIAELEKEFTTELKDSCASPGSGGGSPFCIFELSQSCSLEELNLKYKEIIRLYHPDKVAELGEEIRVVAEKKTKEINGAYELCVEEIKRRSGS